LISEPELREEITTATNKVAVVRTRRDRAQRPRRAREDHQVLLAARQLRGPPHRARHDRRPCKLASEGWDINPAGLAACSPYITERIKRFGEYATDGLTIPPGAFDGRLDLHRYAAGHSATASEAA